MEKTYCEFSQHAIYCITASSCSSLHSLADRGTNGGVAGSYARVIETHLDRKVDIRAIENHEITVIPLVTVGGVTSTIRGEVILIMHQYAYHGENKTIHSSPQIEHSKNIVDDRSIKVGGGQHITTLDNYKIPISIRGTLPCIPLRLCTDKE